MKIIECAQNTPEWHAARLGIPTASSADKLVTPTGKPSTQMEAYALKLAADLFAGEDTDGWQGNAYTERGHEVEAEARAWLAFERDIEIDQPGFVADDEGRFGCSPDGRIDSDGGLIEIKCLPKGHVKALLHYADKGTLPADYLPQIHMQMLVCDAPYCLRVYYHPQLPKVVERVDREGAWDMRLSGAISNCIERRDAALTTLNKLASA